MKYQIEFKPRAIKDLKSVNSDNARRILNKIRMMENDLSGDIKRLTNFELNFRLCIGNYRILFNMENDVVVIYRIKHRREAY